MCVTSLNAILSNTIIGVWDIQHPQYGYRHVLAYQNAPKNLADLPNCMLLHIPSAEPLSPENLIDTAAYPDFLSNMAKSAIDELNRGMKGLSYGSDQNNVITMGIYHIAILNHVDRDALQLVLDQIPSDKQPKIPIDFIDFYAQTFPGFPLVLACFNNATAQKASPIMLHFSPRFKDVFMFNTLESHGHIPVIGEEVYYGQLLLCGSDQIKSASNGFAKLEPGPVSSDLEQWLPTYGAAFQLSNYLENGDLLVNVADVQQSGDADIEVGLLQAA